MKITLDRSMFRDAFERYDRVSNFGYAALDALFDYLEEMEQETGEEMELDVVALCCDYSAYGNEEDMFNEFGYLLPDFEEDEPATIEMLVEALEERTTVIPYERHTLDGVECGWIVGTF